NNIAATVITDHIGKADASVVVAAYDMTYDGHDHTATVTSITGVNGEVDATVGTVDVSHTTHKNAGTYNADYWTFTGTANYNNIAATTITDTIDQVTLTAGIIGNPVKPYDGNTSATLTSANFSLTDLVGMESFTVTQTSGTYNSKDVATADTVTANLVPGDFTATNGAVATNYVLPTSASGDGHVTVANVTASIVGGPTRPYNGGTNATLTSANFSLSGVASGESFTVTQTAGTYNSKDVLAANTVTASLSAGDFTPGAGTLASNYTLPTSVSGPGQITTVTLTASIILNPTKTYDGNTNATLSATNFSLGTLVSGESITVTKTTGTYNSKDVPIANTVSTNLATTDFSAAAGTLLSNYVLPTTASGSGHINPAQTSTGVMS